MNDNSTATILPFRPRCKTYHAEMVLFDGYRRRQWAVVERSPDGSECAFPVYGGKKSEAFAMARWYAKVEAQDREREEALANNPWWRTVMAMSPDMRDLLAAMLNYEKRAREAQAAR